MYIPYSVLYNYTYIYTYIYIYMLAIYTVILECAYTQCIYSIYKHSLYIYIYTHTVPCMLAYYYDSVEPEHELYHQGSID